MLCICFIFLNTLLTYSILITENTEQPTKYEWETCAHTNVMRVFTEPLNFQLLVYLLPSSSVRISYQVPKWLAITIATYFLWCNGILGFERAYFKFTKRNRVASILVTLRRAYVPRKGLSMQVMFKLLRRYLTCDVVQLVCIFLLTSEMFPIFI